MTIDTIYVPANAAVYSVDTGKVIADSTNIADTAFRAKTFLGVSHAVIRPEALYHWGHEWLLTALLSMVVVFAVINFLVPGKIWRTILFPFNYKEMLVELKERFVISSGLIIPILFFFNFILSVTALLYTIYYNALPQLMIDFGEQPLFFVIALSIFIYLLINRLSIWMVTAVMDMPSLARLHIRMNYFVEASTGMILTLLLLVYFYTGRPFLLTAGLLLLFVLFTYKWLLLLILGIKLTKIRLLHLFLYLCTLEMVPLLVAIKWLGNNVY